MADTDETHQDHSGPDESLLSLDTLLKRPTITIDGAAHEITAPGELTIEQGYRLAGLGKKLANLRNTDGLALAQQKQLTKVLNEICDIVMEPVDPEVRAGLKDTHKLAVIEVFTMLLSADKAKLAAGAALKMISQWDGLKPFLGSSAFTAEAPKAG